MDSFVILIEEFVPGGPRLKWCVKISNPFDFLIRLLTFHVLTPEVLILIVSLVPILLGCHFFFPSKF